MKLTMLFGFALVACSGSPVGPTVAVPDAAMDTTRSVDEGAARTSDGAVQISSDASMDPGDGAVAISPNALFVSPSGNDAHDGSLTAPFLTLEKARSAAAADQDRKTIYLRAGIYANAKLALGQADSGETWSYYPPDGVNSAILDGAATSGSTGANPLTIDGGSNITIDGLTIRNARSWGIGIHGGPADPNAGFGAATADVTNITISNNVIHDIHTSGWDGGAVFGTTDIANVTVWHNAIYATTASGLVIVAHYTWNAGAGDHSKGNYSNLSIENNVLFDVCSDMYDCGAIYIQDTTGAPDSATAGVPQSTNVVIKNNFVRDYQASEATLTAQYGANRLYRAVGIYLDDGASNTTVTGNVIANTANVITNPSAVGSTTAFCNNNGVNITFSENLVDLGTTGLMANEAWAPAASPNPDYPMSGNASKQNIFIGKWSGAQSASLFGGGPAAFFFGSGARGWPPSPTPTNNLYFNYGSGTLSTNGNHGNDAAPVTGVDPKVSGYAYTIASDSPVFSAPLGFAHIVGGWGPPGYAIPATGTKPSYEQ